jgi:hypothetical protein
VVAGSQQKEGTRVWYQYLEEARFKLLCTFTKLNILESTPNLTNPKEIHKKTKMTST